MKSRFILFLIFFIPSCLFAQTYKGVIKDKETDAVIPFAKVYFVALNTGTIANEFGVFTIEHYNQREIHLQISSFGYKSIDDVVELDVLNTLIFLLEPSHLNLDEVVISSPSGRLQGENVVSIDSKKLAELQQTSPLTLAEAVSNIPGVDQVSTGAGIGKVVIRGLSGNRIVTYAQGIRIENQQWGDEHGLGIGDVGIESVEVIKGPASLLYGADAIGGVLYFVDERYARHNTVEGGIQTKFLSNTLGTINNASFKIHKGKFKFNLFGTYSSHADYQTPHSERVYNTRFDEKNIKGSIGFNTDKWISNIRYSFLQNNFGIVEDSTFSNATKRNFELPFQNINNHNLSFENVIFVHDSKLKFTLGYANNYRREFEDSQYDQALGLKLNTLTYNVKWYSPIIKNRFNFILGSQGMGQTNLNDGEEILIPDAKTLDLGAFVIGNLNFDKIQFQSGLRMDYRTIDSREMILLGSSFSQLTKSFSGFSYSAGGVYILKKSKIRMNFSSGFRPPNTTELLSNGIQPGTQRYVVGDSKLKNEKASQIDFSYDYENEHFSFTFNPFFNIINNYIFLSPTDSVISGSSVFEYLQTDAYLYGGEVGFHYHPHSVHWLHLESNLATVFAEDQNGNSLPLIPQTNINSIVKVEFSQKSKVQLKNIFVAYTYKLPQQRISNFETASVDYSLLNLGLNVEITTKNKPLELSAGVKNVLNTKYIDHLSRFKTLGIPNQGINFYLGLKIKFQKSIKEKEKTI